MVVLQSPIHSPVDQAILCGQCGGENDRKGDGAKGEAMCMCVEGGVRARAIFPCMGIAETFHVVTHFLVYKYPYLIVLLDASQKVQGHT